MVTGIGHCCPNDSQEFKGFFRTIAFDEFAGAFLIKKRRFCAVMEPRGPSHKQLTYPK